MAWVANIIAVVAMDGKYYGSGGNWWQILWQWWQWVANIIAVVAMDGKYYGSGGNG